MPLPTSRPLYRFTVRNHSHRSISRSGPTEGDLSENAKLWYQQVDPSILSKFYASPPVESAEAFVSRVIEVHQGLKAVNGSTEGNNELKEKDEKARKEKWDELVKIMQELEGMHGWKEVDGLQYYTKDEDPSHKSNVLGECYAKDV